MSLPYLKFYPGDYLGDTAALTTLEHGAYTLLLWHLWQSGGACKSDAAYLARVTRMTPTKFRKAWAEIGGFFYVDGETIRHKRIDAEIGHAERIVEARKEAGKTPKAPRDPNAPKRFSNKNRQKTNEKRIHSAPIEGEKTEGNQQNAEANAQQMLATIPKGMVSVSYETEKPYLTPSGAKALARLLDAAASTPGREEEAKRLVDAVTGFAKGRLTVGGRYTLERFSRSLAEPLHAAGLELAIGPVHSAEVIPLAKVG